MDRGTNNPPSLGTSSILSCVIQPKSQFKLKQRKTGSTFSSGQVLRLEISELTDSMPLITVSVSRSRAVLFLIRAPLRGDAGENIGHQGSTIRVNDCPSLEAFGVTGGWRGGNM